LWHPLCRSWFDSAMTTAMPGALRRQETRADSRHPASRRAPPPALRKAARAFVRALEADVVWLAVRESRAASAVICCAVGARSAPGLGFRIEPGAGIGGAVLRTGEP